MDMHDPDSHHHPDLDHTGPRHRHGYGHQHGVIDPAITETHRGMWALKWSFVGLLATALLQLVVVVISGSVALFADALHNLADAATAIPLAIAFALARLKPALPLWVRARRGSGGRGHRGHHPHHGLDRRLRVPASPVPPSTGRASLGGRRRLPGRVPRKRGGGSLGGASRLRPTLRNSHALLWCPRRDTPTAHY